MLSTAMRLVGFGDDRVVEVEEEPENEGETEGWGDEVWMEWTASKVSAWRTLILGVASAGEIGVVDPSVVGVVVCAVDERTCFGKGE
jgi:hypothetical protein